MTSQEFAESATHRDDPHVPRAMPHPATTTVVVTGTLSLAALVGAFVAYGTAFAVIAFLLGLSAVNIARPAIEVVAASPSLYSGRAVLTGAAGVAALSTGFGACLLAGVAVRAFS